jgi:hypothetical protein
MMSDATTPYIHIGRVNVVTAVGELKHIRVYTADHWSRKAALVIQIYRRLVIDKLPASVQCGQLVYRWIDQWG